MALLLLSADLLLNTEVLIGILVRLNARERERQLGRPRRRWETNIMTDFREVRCGVMDWIDLAQDRESWRALLKAVMDVRVS